MKITDLDCELFIEDLGRVAGGKSGHMMPLPGDDTMTTMAMGEECGIDPHDPSSYAEGFKNEIDSKIADILGSIITPDMDKYL